jgi:hypothetical protein
MELAHEGIGKRLFVVCGRSADEVLLNDAFKQYGAISNIKVVRDKGGRLFPALPAAGGGQPRPHAAQGTAGVSGSPCARRQAPGTPRPPGVTTFARPLPATLPPRAPQAPAAPTSA